MRPEQLAEGIFRISERLPGVAEEFAVYFINDGEGAIIEPGPASIANAVQEAADYLGIKQPKYIIPTHIHLDHAGGVGDIAQQFPNVKIAVHKRGAGHIVKPDMLIEGTRQAYGKNFETDYGPISPVPKPQALPVDEGDVIRVGTRELKIMYTPGHAPHHISVYDSRSQGIFSGDSLGFGMMGNNSVIIVAGFDLEYALDSIDRMQALNPKRIYAAHGTAEREPGEFIK